MKNLSLQLIIIGVPGLFSYLLLRRLRGEAVSDDQLVKFLRIILFAGIGYVSYSLFDALMNLWRFGVFDSQVFERSFDSQGAKGSGADFRDVLGATVCASVATILYSISSRKQWLERLARYLGISDQLGGEELWDYYLSEENREERGSWIYVRDLHSDLIYFGRILASSDKGRRRELILQDVDVYSNKKDSEFLHSAKQLYLSREPNDIVLETPKLKTTEPK